MKCLSPLFLCLILLEVFTVSTTASMCRNLTGEWKNLKGSILKIDHYGKVIHGTFATAVETVEGAAGDEAVHVRGLAHNGLVSFSIKFKESIASFTGQCYGKSSKEIIHTTWLLHSKMPDCDNDWMGTRIGKDDFMRSHLFTANNTVGMA